MASAQNLLGLCFFGCAPDAAFLGFAWWLQFRSGWGTISLFLGVPKATFRHFSGCGFAMASAFSHARPKHLFSEFGLVACRLPSFTLRCALLEATFRNLFSLFLVGLKSNVSEVFWLRFRMVWALHFFLFSGFQKRRFGIFPAAVSQWLRHKTCWGSAFSDALPTQLSWALPGGCSFAVAGARFHCF